MTYKLANVTKLSQNSDYVIVIVYMLPTNIDPKLNATRKVFRSGQVYILRGDKTYTLTGEEL